MITFKKGFHCSVCTQKIFKNIHISISMMIYNTFLTLRQRECWLLQDGSVNFWQSTYLLSSVDFYCAVHQPILIMCESASCQYHNSPMIDFFLLSGNTTTNNADNGSLQSSSNSKTKMAGSNTVIATGSGTISVTASQQLHTVAKISLNITNYLDLVYNLH